MNELKELDCLLIYTPETSNFYRLYGSNMFGMSIPLGLFSIADYLYQYGHSVRILHFGIEKINDSRFSLQRYLDRVKPKLVGLSLHWHLQSYDTIELARQVKMTDKNIFIVLGGMTASCFHAEVMKEFDFIDGIIRGDAETALLTLLRKILNKEKEMADIPNLT